jgi:glycosyltransferase involved in cell wall biosynthesis
MKIGIYDQNSHSVIGGSEYFVAVVADTLCQHHEVELVHHKPKLTVEHLRTLYGTKLDKLSLHYIPPENSFTSLANPWRRYKTERARYSSISQQYDLFISSVHDLPPFCHAPRGALIIHFPYFDRHKTFPWTKDGTEFRKRIRRMYADWEWRKRFEGYQVTMCNSEFTQKYTKKWWDLDSQVIYAPTKSDFSVVNKENMILSVGRFTTTSGTSKRQLELVTAFKELKYAGLKDWSYYSVGGLRDMPEDHAYFKQVSSVASECEAHLISNINLAQLKQLYEQAKIFWHGAGYGEDVSVPMLMEHFGIVTVEAMAAGCIPIIIARGGQPEIVEHGVSGFLWNTLEELKEYTILVMRDKELQAHMSQNARARSRFFSQEMFIKRFMEAMQPLLT